MTSSKLTSDHISSSPGKEMLFTAIVLRESALFRLPLKIRLPPYFPSSSSTNSFHFPRSRFSSCTFFWLNLLVAVVMCTNVYCNLVS